LNRKWLPTLGELIDRLSILQIKEVKIPEHKEAIHEEISNILDDIDNIIFEDASQAEPHGLVIGAEDLRAIIVLAQYNLHIWENESRARAGDKEGNNLQLTHSLNGVRNRAKNKINESISGERIDPKTDCLASEHSEWEPSW